MQQETNGYSEADKRVKERSAAYPGATIEDTLEFVAPLKKSFQKTLFTREDISAVLNRGSTIKRDIAAAVQYGLVDRTIGEGYKLTQLAEHILEPVSQEERMDNIAECFKKPKLYSDLIEKYKGQVLPSDDVLKVILTRQHEITSSAAPQAVEIFIQNATFAGLINKQRVLMPNKSQELSVMVATKEDLLVAKEALEDSTPTSNINNAPNGTPTSADTSNRAPQAQLLLEDGIGKHEIKIVIRLSEKKLAHLIYPDTINAKDIQILKMQIDLLELTLDL